MDKCNCFEDILKRVEPKIREQLPADAIDVRIDWKDRAFVLRENADYAPVNPRVEVEFRKIKRNGEPAANLSKDNISIFATHCAFCGREYVNKKVEEE